MIRTAAENSLSLMISDIRSSGGDARYRCMDAPEFMIQDLENGIISA